MPKYDPTPPRHRGFGIGRWLLAAVLLLVVFAIYLSTIDTEVPVRTIEQDVSDEILKK